MFSRLLRGSLGKVCDASGTGLLVNLALRLNALLSPCVTGGQIAMVFTAHGLVLTALRSDYSVKTDCCGDA